MGKRRINILQHVLYMLEFIIVVPIATLISFLPWFIARPMASGITSFIFMFDKVNKQRAYQNLDVIYHSQPLSKIEKDRIIKKLVYNISQYGIEYLKLGSITQKNYHKFLKFEGYENVDKALSQGKGLIAVTAHIGNWDLLGSIPSKMGRDPGAIINRQFNPYTDAWLRWIREKKGHIKCFYNEVSDLSKIVKHIKKGGIICIVADQTYYFQPIFVPFFGIQSATADGPAKFHLKFKAPIVMSFSIKQDDGTYLMKYEEPFNFESTGDFKADCISIMTWINQRYEEYIKKYPEQWFSLLHGRWEKTKPEDFKDIEWDPY